MNRTATDLSEQSYDELLCHALRHRWIPVAANVGKVVLGSRTWDWLLHCASGCGSRATEWRDDMGARLPGTQRQYYPTDSYRAGCGFRQHEYLTEIRRRLVAMAEADADVPSIRARRRKAAK